MKALTIILALFSVQAFSKRKIAQFTEVPGAAYFQCIKNVANNPDMPPALKGNFHKIGDEEVYIAWWYMNDSEDFESYAYLSLKGLMALRLPIYKYKLGGSAEYKLPRDITHIKYKGKDVYYIADNDSVELITLNQVAEKAIDLQKNPTSIKNNFKKYEDYLASIGSSAINVSSDPHDIDAVLPILDSQRKMMVKQYLYGKFQNHIPDRMTLDADYHKFNNLEPERRKKYERSYLELKQQILSDLHKVHPECKGIVLEEEILEAFENYWAKAEPKYTFIHKRFFVGF